MTQPLPPELADPLGAELALIENRCAAARSALGAGRLDAVWVWVADVLRAADRLRVQTEKAKADQGRLV